MRFNSAKGSNSAKSLRRKVKKENLRSSIGDILVVGELHSLRGFAHMMGTDVVTNTSLGQNIVANLQKKDIILILEIKKVSVKSPFSWSAKNETKYLVVHAVFKDVVGYIFFASPNRELSCQSLKRVSTKISKDPNV